jgi:hypothetical protein
VKGREAVRAAGRRTQEAIAEAEQARADLAAERADHKEETDALRAEIKKLKANQIAEAGRLAAEEVSRRLAEKEEERRRRGISDDIAKNSLYLKDKFVRNVCKHISMTTGISPVWALQVVLPWMTDEDNRVAYDHAKMLVKLGLPSDGWVGAMLRSERFYLRNKSRSLAREGRIVSVPLERAEEEGNWMGNEIHPKYEPRWYPHVEYGSVIELVDDLDAGEPVTA